MLPEGGVVGRGHKHFLQCWHLMNVYNVPYTICDDRADARKTHKRADACTPLSPLLTARTQGATKSYNIKYGKWSKQMHKTGPTTCAFDI